MWQKPSYKPNLRSCEKTVRDFSNIVQSKIFEILSDQILCQGLRIHAGFDDLDPFSSHRRKKETVISFQNESEMTHELTEPLLCLTFLFVCLHLSAFKECEKVDCV